MESAYHAENIDEAVRRATELIQNAQARYTTDPVKARYGLELAERLLDEHLLSKYNMSRYNPNNPCIHLFNEIMDGWKILEQILSQNSREYPFILACPFKLL